MEEIPEKSSELISPNSSILVSTPSASICISFGTVIVGTVVSMTEIV